MRLSTVMKQAQLRLLQLRQSTFNTLAVLTVLSISMVTPAALSASQQPAGDSSDIANSSEVLVPITGIALVGYEVRPSPNGRNVPAVVLLHSSGTDSQSLLSAARSLADRGYI